MIATEMHGRIRTLGVPILVLSLAALAIVGGLRFAPPSPVTGSGTGSVHSAPAVGDSAADTSATVRSALSRVPAPAPPPRHVSAVLPDLKAHVIDWREFAPKSLVVQLTPELRVPFVVSAVERHEHRAVMTARLGADADIDPRLAGSFLVATAVASDRWDAIVALPGMEYRIAIRPTAASVEPAALPEFACLEAGAAPFSVESAGIPVSAGDTPGPLTIDVLFLYNAQALTDRNNDTQAIDADCSNYIAACNAVLANSGITAFRWHYLGVGAIPDYPTTETIGDDLRAIRFDGPQGGFVFTNQSSKGADQVVLLAGGVKKPAAGSAWIGGNYAHSAASYPYPTLNDGQRSTRVTSYYLICHELGHNFGCRHHRASDSTAADGDGRHHYGHITPGNFGTVMSSAVGFSHDLTPYFSTPHRSFRGHPLGLAKDHPQAAHNALTLEQDAARIAALGERAHALPTIVEHPRSVTATLGGRVDLSVTAAGGGLTYVWQRNGERIPPIFRGFSMTSLTANQVGSYTVTVSNSFGSVTSEAAEVSLASPPAPPAPPPAPPPAASGGGGGGSMPSWLVVTLFLASLLRPVAGRAASGS